MDGLAKDFLERAAEYLQKDFMPKIRHCLDLLSEEEFWRCGSAAENSVGNLILHLSGNVRQWIIAGMGGAEDKRDRPREFSTRSGISKQEAMTGLERTVEEAISVLKALPVEELFSERTIQKYRKTGLGAIFHVVEHFAYHTGQIVFATKMFSQTDLKFYNL